MTNNIPKEFVDQITELVEGIIKNSNIPEVKSCKFVSNDGNGKYTVRRGNETYKVMGNGTYEANSIVQVLLPDGKWTRAIIIASTSPITTLSVNKE